MKILSALTVSVVVLTTPVAADVFDDCAQVVQSNDQALAKRVAERVLFGEGIYVPEVLSETVSECLQLAGETTVAYSRARNRFIDADRARAENDRLEQREKREAEKRQNAQKLAETVQTLKEQQQIREREVYARLDAACVALYKSDPNLTITNKLCLDVFLVKGLPD